ncbi:molybdopterin-dependent oxidoreductase [Actinomycetospora aeridis]|uniref:Molybdopterin-dependent oxidoreductase n=1 Tax=Actinomycetospora aeridis TaxID=3129231 RepID=A0ABU8NCY4_9PSEU
MATVPMEPGETTKWQPAPGRLSAPTTPVDDLYVIGHFGIAHVPADDWGLRVDGLVERPLRVGLAELRAMPSVTVQAVLECFGNPLRPDEPTRRAGNVEWRGVPVAAVLDQAGAPGRGSLWAAGLDSGVFDGTPCTEYLKDLPLDVVRERGVLAYEMNGAPLTAEHGHPVRLFVPGYFGTNNVKWLRSLTVADHRPEHLFTTTLYLRTAPGGTTPEPVRDLDVNSIITDVRSGDRGPEVRGWAWSSSEIVGVDVAVVRRGAPDAGDGWQDADLGPVVGGPYGWRRFTASPGLASGADEVTARARDAAGRHQPLRGARNACHVVAVRDAADPRT